MARRKPLSQADIADREDWTEVQALRCGPGSYDPCEILTPKQRRELTRHAVVSTERGKQFVDALTNEIKRVAAQEKPTAIAEATKRCVIAAKEFKEALTGIPLSVKMDTLSAMQIGEPTEAGIACANEKLRLLELRVTSSKSDVRMLIPYAEALQRLACEFSSDLASNWKRLKRWLEIALAASGETTPGKNDRKAYFDRLMLPQTAQGSVDLSRRPLTLDAGGEAPSSQPCDLEVKLSGVLI